MQYKSKVETLYGTEQDRAVGEAICKLRAIYEAREAANPTDAAPEPRTKRAREPEPDKPGSLIAAERAVWHWEVIEKIQPAVCGGLERCKLGRCRRSKRCAELERLKPLIEEAHATLARELALWKQGAATED